MGEIFAIDQPAVPMPFTGERMTSDARGQIEYEHLHRYCFARFFCRGKRVVDIASGEGYGSAMLAQVARQVVGVEVAPDSAAHAGQAYPRANLQFVCGDARAIPVASGWADVIVSFETIEHLYEHDQFLAEIRRVLKPEGQLVISSPDSEVYSYVGSEVNPFHVHELTAAEFKDLLRGVFSHTVFYAQRALIGSAMTAEAATPGAITFVRRADAYIDASAGLPHAPYLLGVASEADFESFGHSLYIDLTRDAHLLTSRFGVASAQDRLPVVEAENVELRGSVTRLETALSVAEARAAESIAQQQLLQSQLEKQQVVAADLVKQRDAAQLAAAEAVHSQLVELRKNLAAAQSLAKERSDELQAAQRDGEYLREQLGSVQQQLLARGAALDADERETRRLRDALYAAERRCGEQERLVAELQRALNFSRRTRLFGLFGKSGSGIGAAIRAGDRSAQSGDWAAAAQHYRQALERSPDLMPTWVQFGHVLKELGDLAGAEAAYRRALILDDAVADTHLQLGHLLKRRERWEEAVQSYSRAAELAPDTEDARRELGELAEMFRDQADAARDSGSWALAARLYRKFLHWRADDGPIWVQLGHALKEQGEYAGAEEAYRRALSLDPSIADTHLQLGHLLKMQGRRTQAIDAYATAVKLDPQLAPAQDALRALVGYSPSETERALLANGKGHVTPTPGAKLNGSGEHSWNSGYANGEPDPGLGERIVASEERYGALFPEASRAAEGGRDVIWLGVIDWHFRIQRPQHLATNLADAGARVFYISLVFEPADERGRFRIVESPHLDVFEVRLRLWQGAAESIYRGLSDAAVHEIQLALDEMVLALNLNEPIVVVQYPAWHKVAFGIPGATVVYDCLDLATGFNNAPPSLAGSETAILAGSDLVITTSQPLVEHVGQYRPSVLIRNAADTEFFSRAFSERPIGTPPVIGYFGAIAEWFAIDWIEYCAKAKPDWDFRLIGRTDGCDIERAARLPNVRFYGEQPYGDLPKLLSDFDVALIPFKLVELTRCTNPVKLYEYMSAGKPVVASPMPEVLAATDLVYIAEDPASFVDRVAQALRDDTPALRVARRDWARDHTWANRARQLAAAIEASSPVVSVVVLTYNNWDYTAACLSSLRNWSDYRNLEIIVVDNASTDGTREKLLELGKRDARLRVILNETNLGFAAGNNVGIAAATGEYVVLLNNDTYVTRGWVRDLIRPMQLDSSVGLVGPLTNNIGNEQKVRLVYSSMAEMQSQARRFSRERLRHTVETDNLAFFCAAIRKKVIDEVGLLDEAYGIGFFEDDDYCRRVKQAGYRLLIADDVFVHHHLSASFDKLGAKASELMSRNRALFEQRWGPWKPHEYRAEPGFG